MTRNVACLPVFMLFCGVAFAQNSAPVPDVAPVTSAATSGASPEVRQFQKIEDSWSTAMNQRDQYALELVLSPLFVDVSATGDITTRNQQLAQLITGEDKSMHLEQRLITVRMLGDIAVANGTYVLHHRVGSTQEDQRGVFTHVFEKMRGGWVCVNSQRTVLREDAPNAKGKKRSDAEMPFHIPLFSKGDKKD